MVLLYLCQEMRVIELKSVRRVCVIPRPESAFALVLPLLSMDSNKRTPFFHSEVFKITQNRLNLSW